MLKNLSATLAVLGLALTTAGAQQPAPARDTLPDNPGVFDSSTRGPSGGALAEPKFRVVALKGLQRPYGMAFLPDGGILITERAGRLRIVRNNVLDPQPISGMPAVLDRNLKGLNDIALHPDFARNGMLYFTYYKPVAGSQDAGHGGPGPRAIRRRACVDRGQGHLHHLAGDQSAVGRAARVRPRRENLSGHRRADPGADDRRQHHDDDRRAEPGQPLREIAAG